MTTSDTILLCYDLNIIKMKYIILSEKCHEYAYMQHFAMLNIL